MAAEEKLKAIVSQYPSANLAEALETAQSIDTEWRRASALATIAAVMPE